MRLFLVLLTHVFLPNDNVRIATARGLLCVLRYRGMTVLCAGWWYTRISWVSVLLAIPLIICTRPMFLLLISELCAFCLLLACAT